jgi:hypothetical protein
VLAQSRFDNSRPNLDSTRNDQIVFATVDDESTVNHSTEVSCGQPTINQRKWGSAESAGQRRRLDKNLTVLDLYGYTG